ncbi:hypothetical protein SESBI_45730 [Sesbania bispinosa]|nr:hypothetical protein SESBI_45730 [Sesbania bispinosa]
MSPLEPNQRHESKDTEPYTMPQNGSLERIPPASNGAVAVAGSNSLRASPKQDHKPDDYDDLQLEFNPLVFSSLERYLPFHMLNLSRDVKVQYMRNILLRYMPESERIRFVGECNVSLAGLCLLVG